MNKDLIERLTLNQFHLIPFSFESLGELHQARITTNILLQNKDIQEIHYQDDTIEIKGPSAKDFTETVYLESDNITKTLLMSLSLLNTDVIYHSVVNVIGPQYTNYIYITIHFIEA